MALLQGPSVFIHLDPRKPQVVVPAYFKKQPQLVLQVGLNMAIPIPDLKVDDEGVSCTLSFNRRPFWCKLPWTAIYALVGEALEGEEMKGMLWPDDVPAEIAQHGEGKSSQPAGVGPKAPRAPRDAKRKAAAVGAPPPPAEPQSSPSVPTKLGVKPGGGVKPGSEWIESPVAAEADAGSERPAPAAATATTPRPKSDTAKSGKRELPPYLRVVK
jgi:stringent starvation protein B